MCSSDLTYDNFSDLGAEDAQVTDYWVAVP